MNRHMKGSSLIEMLVALAIFSTALLGAGFLTLHSFKLAQDGLRLTHKILQSHFYENSTPA